ncbi:hypothetical protein J3R30DRAFT_3483144 [Lentinula aciculospora]|uniref:Uncharacterized protein n=1 Tax=Lentinula aciculospora TaxID=153920 RepID=A0A9W9ABL2_9AGAR|nr:hypothetical protein J3R30DRAFT_3483144 [Lentinula aciculospora]
MPADAMAHTLFYISMIVGSVFATNESFLRRDTPSQGYFDPSSNGGSMLTTVEDTSPLGQQEPINLIISANSDSDVLKDGNTDGGLQTYFNSLGFAGECLGNHLGDDQQANLGDGNGLINQTGVMRWDYGNVQTGTCEETIDGGNHYRYWIQNGSAADSNAIFMAASYELPASSNHDIVVNGYNFGRDWIVGNITSSTIPTGSLTNSSSYSGNTSFNGFNFSTTIQYTSGLLPNTSVGINHNLTVATDGQNAVDGLVAVLTVKITATNTSAGATPSSSSNNAALVLPISHLLWLPFAILTSYIA